MANGGGARCKPNMLYDGTGCWNYFLCRICSRDCDKLGERNGLPGYNKYPGQCRHDEKWVNSHGHTCEDINKNPDSARDWTDKYGLYQAGDYCSKFCNGSGNTKGLGWDANGVSGYGCNRYGNN